MDAGGRGRGGARGLRGGAGDSLTRSFAGDVFTYTGHPTQRSAVTIGRNTISGEYEFESNQPIEPIPSGCDYVLSNDHTWVDYPAGPSRLEVDLGTGDDYVSGAELTIAMEIKGGAGSDDLRGGRLADDIDGGGGTVRREIGKATRKVKLHPLLAGRLLAPGATLQVRVTLPEAIGTVAKFKVRDDKLPVRTSRCLPPGTSKPQRCA